MTRETKVARQERLREIEHRLAREYPDAGCALRFENPFELLVATILSAQCTDERVNSVTRELFKKYRVPRDYYSVDRRRLERDIHSTGFFRNKARSIQGAARRIDEVYGGRVPSDFEELLTIPGVGRKTAHCVRGNAYGLPAITVDTHVGRLSRRLGISRHLDPGKVEVEIAASFRKDSWSDLSHRLIRHGRLVCRSRKPRCEACPLSDLCPSAFPEKR